MPMENIFCSKCHKVAAQIRETKDRKELVQNGRVLLSLSAESKGNKIGIRCPSGHSLRVEL